MIATQVFTAFSSQKLSSAGCFDQGAGENHHDLGMLEREKQRKCVQFQIEPAL